MTKRGPGLIITADDFGLHESVNQAVERAHREGVLSAASLMVAAPAAADAIARARAFPVCASACIWCWPTVSLFCPTPRSRIWSTQEVVLATGWPAMVCGFSFSPGSDDSWLPRSAPNSKHLRQAGCLAGSRQHPQTFSSASHAAAADYRHRPTVRLAGDTLAQRKAHSAPAQTLACAIATQTIEGRHRAQRPYGRHRVLREIR